MLIDLRKINKIYGQAYAPVHALVDFTLSVDEGEMIAIMGPSGSGKSTLMNILGCLDKPTSGRYLFDGAELQLYTDYHLSKFRNRQIGFVFQSFNLLPQLNVLKNVELPLYYSEGMNEEKRLERCLPVIKEVGLEDRIFHRPTELSGGEMQRVAIARALVTQPRMIMADEPTGNLDSKTGKIILEIFKKLNSKGKTIILITHDSEVAKIAHRIILLKDGKIENDETR